MGPNTGTGTALVAASPPTGAASGVAAHVAASTLPEGSSGAGSPADAAGGGSEVAGVGCSACTASTGEAGLCPLGGGCSAGNASAGEAALCPLGDGLALGIENPWPSHTASSAPGCGPAALSLASAPTDVAVLLGFGTAAFAGAGPPSCGGPPGAKGIAGLGPRAPLGCRGPAGLDGAGAGDIPRFAPTTGCSGSVGRRDGDHWPRPAGAAFVGTGLGAVPLAGGPQ